MSIIGTFTSSTANPGKPKVSAGRWISGTCFSPRRAGAQKEGKRICAGCPVAAQCLEYALSHDERFGVWGGFSERERRQMKRRVA